MTLNIIPASLSRWDARSSPGSETVGHFESRILIADDGRVKTADFGMANCRKTSLEQLVSHWSPERFRSLKSTWRGAIWSFEMMLYDAAMAC
jgi:serine/threonine protein kinase